MKTPLPQTNLLGHLALTEWYREVERLEQQGVRICLLMTRIPGEYTSRRVHCDIPRTREQFVKRHEPCYHLIHCLPRKTFPREATLEANAL